MTLSARHASLALGGLGLLVSAYPGTAGEHGSQFVNNTARCSNYGAGYTAVESDACARIGGRIRVQPAANAGLHPEIGWSAGRASSATLRVEGGEQRAVSPTHLRVQGGLEYPNPFR